ncbi:MAG: LptE family protein [Candidatus Omnitrophica bacterium]|nr:LptE family protein [Candidatus Omnitrophota bacterium]
MSRNRRVFLLAALCLLVSSCGYSTTRLLPSNYRTIYIEPFKNRIPITEEISDQEEYKTSLPELDRKVTRAVINQFLFDGNLRITTKPEQADLLLDGEITDFSRQDLRRQDDNTVEEYRLNLTASVIVRDRQHAVIFQEPSLIGDTTYFLSGSLAKSETAAVEDLLTDFSKRVVERVIENW